jgi:hypothetical protein
MDLRPTRNFRCTQEVDTSSRNHDIINKCARKVHNVIIEKELGKGTYGIVYFARARVKENGLFVIKDLAIKKIVFVPTVDRSIDLFINEMNYEIEYSHLMAETGLGPVVYDAFYIRGPSKMIQYIFMEPMEINGWDILSDYDYPDHKKQMIIDDMIDLLYFQIFEHSMYCIDIKPNNFVIKNMESEKPIVKMIDFGADFCDLDHIPPIINDITQDENSQKEVLYVVLLIQLIITILKIVSKTKTKNNKIVMPFFEDSIFIKYVVEQQEITKEILKHIMEHDPDYLGMMIMHYFKFALSSKYKDADHNVLAEKATKIILRLIKSRN